MQTCYFVVEIEMHLFIFLMIVLRQAGFESHDFCLHLFKCATHFLIDSRLVLDQFGSLGEFECAKCLLEVRRRGGHICNHEGLRIASKALA